MFDTSILWVYFLMVFGVIVLPGMDMAFVSASAMFGGRRAGGAAVAGIIVGGFCHLVIAIAGIAALLQLWPALFRIIVIAGAVYLAWIGLSLARVREGFNGWTQTSDGKDATAPMIVFRRAVLTCLTNPKAYIFMFAVFPQFLRPAAGPVWQQALALGAITAVTQGGVYGVVAILSARAAGWMGASPRASLWLCRAVGVFFIVAAIYLATQGWQADSALSALANPAHTGLLSLR